MPAPIPASLLRRLETAARAAAKTAYAPYSKFKVGAAVLAGSHRIYPGSNVENASYGLCNCAERSAIFTAVSAGERRIDAVVVYTSTAEPTLPCGACRQVINEFGPRAVIIGICRSGRRMESSLSELLSHAFGPRNLLRAARQHTARRVR